MTASTILTTACHVAVPCLIAILAPDPPPVLLAGQSNAVYVAEDLERAYRGRVTTIAQTSVPIQHWNADDGPLWPATAAAAERVRFRAIVFWQGEGNRSYADRYLSDLRDLIGRIRARLKNPSARVVIVQILDKPENAGIRQAQQEFTRTDDNAVLVSSDGFGLAASDHLTPAGYRIVAERMAGALDPSDVRFRGTTSRFQQRNDGFGVR